MSVFEDLIDELKNENLLEDTKASSASADAAARRTAECNADSDAGSTGSSDAPATAAWDPELDLQSDGRDTEKDLSDRDFFRKRALEEVTSLQMVEHVLSGVEREHMKISPTPFDDLNAKKALHKFMQVTAGPGSVEHSETELALQQETEAWNLALYARDARVSVGDLRRFCEESRPGLSSQALIALARFYRNSPYSEDVRAKFDFVMTRLFSRETGEEMRTLLFEHEEMIGHINTLYASWSSIALYTNKDDQVDVSLTVTRFDEFRVEVENVETFEELLNTDFFTRVRIYKEESAEMFYVPEVLAAAIKCNLAIGNRYIELISRERAKRSASKVEERYGTENDQMVSDAAGKTLLLANVLTLDINAGEPGDANQPNRRTSVPRAQPVRVQTSQDSVSPIDLFGVNKWLMMFCLLFILVGAGVYVWAEKFAGGGEQEASETKAVEIADPEVTKFLRSTRSTHETFFAIIQPTFNTLSEDEQKVLLGKVWKIAQEQRLQKVNLLNDEGRSVAFASKDRLELVRQ